MGPLKDGGVDVDVRDNDFRFHENPLEAESERGRREDGGVDVERGEGR